METSLLFRRGLDEEGEFEAATSIIDNVHEYRSQIPENNLVFARYSVLPFYQELEQELALKNSRLVNSYKQHRYIADIEQWYNDIKEYTPETWFEWHSLEEGSYVVKGRTNSRKFQWETSMFAKDLKSLRSVIHNLFQDDMISNQGLCVRKYVPLVTYEVGINEMRFTNEWRMFFHKEQLIDYGFYWSCYDGERPSDIAPEGKKVAQEVAKIISQHTNFFVIDMAQTESGDWIVIEINDGQMSGLSTIDPVSFYTKLKEVF